MSPYQASRWQEPTTRQMLATGEPLNCGPGPNSESKADQATLFRLAYSSANFSDVRRHLLRAKHDPQGRRYGRSFPNDHGRREVPSRRQLWHGRRSADNENEYVGMDNDIFRTTSVRPMQDRWGLGSTYCLWQRAPQRRQLRALRRLGADDQLCGRCEYFPNARHSQRRYGRGHVEARCLLIFSDLYCSRVRMIRFLLRP